MAEKKTPVPDVIEVSISDPESIAFDAKATRRLLRKIDLCLIPFLALLYLLSFLDRSNIGNARLAGLEKDLNMKGFDYNCGMRMAIFFSAATAAGAFGGLLARGIMEIDGKANLAAWQWIFILEGVATFVVGCIAFFALYDYPETANFLTEKEKAEVERRLEADRSSLANEFAWKYFWDAVKDWKIWIHMMTTLCTFTPLYSFSLFLPTIIKTLGYTNNKAQLMTVPPYVVACAFCIGGGILADRKRQRGIFMIFFCCFAILGFAMLAASEGPKVKYAGTFFAAIGIYPNVTQGVAWNGNNIGGSTKRGVGIAMRVMLGNMGGVISAFLYLKKDSPHYRSGHCAIIGFSTMTLLLSAFMSVWSRRENKRRDAQYAKKPDEYTPQEKALEREKGDYASFFRYTI